MKEEFRTFFIPTGLLEECLKNSIINYMENKKKILIIDDDNFLLDMYVVKFKEAGFDVNASLDNKDALNKLREGFSPDIILLDIIMPGIDEIGRAHV